MTARSASAVETAIRPRNRVRRLGAIVATTIFAVAFAAGCLSKDQQSVQTLTNQDRAANGVAALADYGPADAKAQAWAEHLASQSCTPSVNCLSHTNLADGYASGTWCRLGENVGMGPTLSSVNDGFMHSPPHRANILDTRFDHIGTGVARNATTGYVFVVQEFVDVC